MDLKALDLFLLTKLTSHHVDHVTCIECCKYFIAPETANCGHTLCHSCWRGRRTCPACAASLQKRSLKLNLPMQALTGHIQELGEAFEKLFNIKLDEFVLDTSHTELEPSADPTRNVKDWLASSQNHFSASLLHTETTMHERNSINIISSSEIQIHENTKKNVSSEKLIYIQQPQDDWDKIEHLPDTEEIPTNKENVMLPNDQFMSIQDSDYSTDNPRRSSRNRESKSETTLKTLDISLEKLKSKNCSSEIDKKSSTAKQNWNNVKRMRKEFSKLNKKNRNKLNVSIEMCKKNQTAIKPNILKDTEINVLNNKESPIYTIEDSTPAVVNEKENTNKDVLSNQIKNVVNNIISEDDANKLSNYNNNFEVGKKNESLKDNNNVDCTMIRDNNDILDKNILKHNNDASRTQTKSSRMPFLKKGLLYPKQSIQTININSNTNEKKNIDDDIEISIKIGSTVTNIVIKKKTNNIQLKVNSDQEVQTSLGSYDNYSKNDNTSKNQDIPDHNNDIILEKNTLIETLESLPKSNKTIATHVNALEKSVSTKINTASAETVTAPFEITESVEKELSNIMECDEGTNKNIQDLPILSPPNSENNKNNISNSKQKHTSQENVHETDAFDGIFDIDYAQDQSVNMLSDSKHIASEILMPTDQSKTKNISQKRDRDCLTDEISIPDPKKFKSIFDNNSNKVQATNKTVTVDNDSINYDHVMDEVFANIDAEIEESQKKKSTYKEVRLPKEVIPTQSIHNLQFDKEKCSENIFSVTEKESETIEVIRKDDIDNGSTTRHIANLLTPGVSDDMMLTNQSNLPKNTELVEKEIFTPHHDNDDSDKSVVEETPQKNVSFSKTKNKPDSSLQKCDKDTSRLTDNSEVLKSVIDISDSVVDSTKSGKRVTVMETTTKLPNTETPPDTINRFFGQIKHKSTPVARKSLNFESENIDDNDPEQTLCPSSIVGKTTQEREFMSKAFEQTPTSPVKKPLVKNNTKLDELKYCIAGSCLSLSDINKIKLLCRKYSWKYVDKYTNELTHLVVGVDSENKSQRSVKYMCALAASKWIVSFQWVEACLNTNIVLGENHYEALDGTGEPGPKRSRLAKKKLFDGITFFCMPPFSVLDADTLKEMLEASSGNVVSDAKSLTAIKETPAFLLAEPEHTQEDRFMYLALELGIVPVNYEWALNCLGSYTLSSVHDLLLCPSALLPPATAKWPSILMSRDSE